MSFAKTKKPFKVVTWNGCSETRTYKTTYKTETVIPGYLEKVPMWL